ncbi:MAG: trypsin-like peptidase domain-containing protein [Candidatus Acidiferrum sp.]
MHKHIALLILSACLAASSVAQTPGAVTPQPQASATTRPANLATRIKKTVGFMRVGFVREDGPHVSEGTCFFVFYEDKRGGDNYGFMYVVTNRHVARPGIADGKNYPVLWTHIRLNLQNLDLGSEEDFVPTGNQLQWTFPTDEAVDLAVMPLLPDQAKFDYIPIRVSEFATHDVVDAQQVAEGDSILFTGYFYQFPGLRKFQPIIREGVLAMMPDEKLDTTLKKPGHLYLADVHVFGGNSGSPLFVNLGGMRSNGLIGGIHYMLLGVVSGFYHEDSNLNLTVATTLTGTLEQNSGISLVVPVDELKALLDNPALQADRNRQIAALNTKK